MRKWPNSSVTPLPRCDAKSPLPRPGTGVTRCRLIRESASYYYEGSGGSAFGRAEAHTTNGSSLVTPLLWCDAKLLLPRPGTGVTRCRLLRKSASYYRGASGTSAFGRAEARTTNGFSLVTPLPRCDARLPLPRPGTGVTRCCLTRKSALYYHGGPVVRLFDALKRALRTGLLLLPPVSYDKQCQRDMRLMLNFQIMEECLEVCGITVISALTVSDINSKLLLIFY